MNTAAILEVVLALLAFVPFGASVLYARTHAGTTPPIEINVALFAAFAAVALIILFAERKGMFRA